MMWFILFSLALSSHGLPLGMPLPDGKELITQPSTIDIARATTDTPALNVEYDFEIQDLPYYSHNKFTVQREITERDIIRHRNATWKTFFPEILAAILTLITVIIIICWYNCTHRGRDPPVLSSHLNESERQDTRATTRPFTRGASMPELPLSLPKAKPLPKCSKPACICSPNTGGNKKGKRKWNYKEDNEAYGPATNV